MLAALFAGCATTQVSGGGQTTQAERGALSAASELARNDASLSGQAKADNARQIERLLAAIDNASLARGASALRAGDPLYPFVGRALLSRGLPLPHAFERGAQWRFDLNNRPAAERDGYRPPVKLAVLLPLSGQLATAAAPVRDGLLAGYYGESRRRPEINFYDTAGTAGGAVAAYASAAAAGADFIIGPLGRDEVSAVFGQANLSVPVLALNRGTSAPPAGNAGFSLAPEDDGIIAAEYLLGRERRTAVVINGNDDSGRRAATAFRERFTQRGGTVVETIGVAEVPGSISANLATAAQRGVDAVFLAMKGNTARAIAPQLALAGLAGKSRVASSQLISGTGKPEQDSALDGIVYPTEVWTARGLGGLPAASVVGARLPTARGPAARLFAFGYDAWMLTAYLEKLATGNNARLEGATGELTLDGFGNVIRMPAWATFNDGRAVPVSGGG
nr:penicillin-binding protein activator [Pseudoxanthomonas gei]